MMTSWGRAGRRLLAAALAVVLLGGCVDLAPPDQDPLPTGPMTYEGQVLPDLTVDPTSGRTLWQTHGTDRSRAPTVRAR
ncbi:hypothetical protein ACQCX2_13605 [Propionibacteriaceae bacterium Y1700]|uniref:hypothetical protein n=1 Tax=Microlunatus sp. Y1700 TaxID=3418487 RepID=UPI003DA71109